jgi:DNA-binding transcriptional LysR family regulator
MRRKIPSTAALAAFEAAARHQSFTLAADELAVTQSAVCRQVAALEEFLGVKLFRRSRRGVGLTPAGAEYGRSVRVRLDEVERDTLALMSRAGAGGSIELGVVPTFATRWLIPRLADFQAAHPGFTVNLHVRTRAFLFEESGLDAAIHAGASEWPGTRSLRLMGESLVAVAAPLLLGKRLRYSVVDVARLPLLQMSTRPYAWRDWFASLGVRVPRATAGPRFELFSMLTEAAVHGLGVALVPRILVQAELGAGTLRRLTAQESDSGLTYRYIVPEKLAGDPTLEAFGAWLQSVATAETDHP